MPAPVSPDAKRNSTPLTVLFWIGVALAPVAALILLVADGNGPLRFAAVLAILAVVLIGLSIALRPDGEGGQARTEELLDEMEQLRHELRGEIVAAAQRGNQALDQAQRAQEAVAAVRRRLEVAGGAPSGGEEPPGAGRARVPAAEPAEDAPAGRTRAVAQEDGSGRWGRTEWEDDEDRAPRAQPTRHGADRPASPQYGADRPASPQHGADRSASSQYGTERPTAGQYGAERPAGGYGERPGSAGAHGAERPAAQAGVYGGVAQSAAYGAAQPGVYGAAARPAEHDGRPDPAHRQVGMVRHTETVHVTTRHTIVDGGPAEPSGGRYGGGYAGSWSPSADERPWGAGRSDERSWAGAGAGSGPEERSWSGYAGQDERARSGDERQWGAQSGPRDESGRDGQRDDRGWAGRRDERWSGAGEQQGWSDQPGTGESGWSAPADRTGQDQDRPARPDDTGEYWAQLRAGDRWASVRDDENGRELRVGERRAEVHADATGTEYRMADRWASVRREESRRDREEPRRDYDEPRREYDASRREYDEPRREYGRGGDEGWRGGWAEPEERPALPAGGVPVPDEWRPPRQRGYRPGADVEPERVGRRARVEEEHYGYPPQDDVPRAGGARPGDRWR
ncbi:hypothetical protein [Micromonospora sp. WMMD812]|uniref:hypothetical protein n=1 Tax=Micromonospora sp. WMMD812 TaxID=3015152 RepID=UPI00248B935E|nr:hypothetical protein [Micromonospora sp. WMMD812]WBB66052.1 hypothetical protein O7603_23175 [Micromonospora sp. WMMD812]